MQSHYSIQQFDTKMADLEAQEHPPGCPENEPTPPRKAAYCPDVRRWRARRTISNTMKTLRLRTTDRWQPSGSEDFSVTGRPHQYSVPGREPFLRTTLRTAGRV